MDYTKPYFNHRNYILEEIDMFQLSSDEILLILLIDYANEFHRVGSISYFATKMNKTAEEIDQLFSQLQAKGYLDFKFENGKVNFSIDGIFKEQRMIQSLDATTFELFQREFKRTFSQMELSRINDWVTSYSKDMIIFALREAVIHNKLHLDYINKILIEWKQRSVTIEDLKNGNY